jgi:hypothetical protein
MKSRITELLIKALEPIGQLEDELDQFYDELLEADADEDLLCQVNSVHILVTEANSELDNLKEHLQNV